MTTTLCNRQKDVERQKVYSIEDISRTVSGKYKSVEDVNVRQEEKKEGNKEIAEKKQRSVKRRQETCNS